MKGLFLGLEQSSTNTPIHTMQYHNPFNSASRPYVNYDKGSSSASVFGYLNEEIKELSSRLDKIENKSTLCSYRINNLSSDIYSLKHPIDIIFKTSDNEILAIMPDLEIYGEGANEIEALSDIKAEIIDLFEYLNSVAPSHLGKLPKRWKKIVNSLIEKDNAN